MISITSLDPNFRVPAELDRADIRWLDACEQPFSLHGVYWENGLFRRMPEAVARDVSEGVLALHTHTAGGRLRFTTDSPYIAIHAVLPGIGRMPHFALSGSAGFDLYESKAGYIKTFVPPMDMTSGYEGLAEVGEGGLRTYTLHFPLYSQVSELYIGLSETAQLLSPPPYRIALPIVYYGSSITQGGCASRPGMAYPNILSRRLDADQINLGFSGNARAEAAMAAYIARLSMSAFVYDYDHNAPSCEHLTATHAPLFRAVRDAHPDLPILILSRPTFDLTAEESRRRDIIRATYEAACAAGDSRVSFLDGPTLMQSVGRDGTVDGCHPTDLGFVAMAAAVEKELRGLDPCKRVIRPGALQRNGQYAHSRKESYLS